MVKCVGSVALLALQRRRVLRVSKTFSLVGARKTIAFMEKATERVAYLADILAHAQSVSITLEIR